jgi:hypothetical protein
MSVANFPFRPITYLASAAADTAVPATAANAAGTSLVVLKRADASEIVVALPAGVYTMNANLTLNLANNETAVQQIELQIARLTNLGGGAVQFIVASSVFCATRTAPAATFAAVVNVDYHLQCGHANLEVPAGQFWGIRCLINGNPVGNSTISDATFAATLVGLDAPTIIFVD